MARIDRTTGMVACALAGAITSMASAGLVSDIAITVPENNVEIFVEYLGHTADYEGNLYFLGTGSKDNVLNPVPNSDSTGLGQFLLNNHTSFVGQEAQLLGVFNAGDILHFAYDVVAPTHIAAELFRTDTSGDQKYFLIDPETWYFGVEDLRKPDTDLDYDDIQLQLSFRPVPTPAGLSLFALGAITQRRRRRRA